MGLLLQENSLLVRSREETSKQHDAVWQGGCVSPGSLFFLATRCWCVAASLFCGQHAELWVRAARESSLAAFSC